MRDEHKRAIILFGVLAVIAIVIFLFHKTFGKGLLLGVLLAAAIYVLRSFLPKRH